MVVNVRSKRLYPSQTPSDLSHFHTLASHRREGVWVPREDGLFIPTLEGSLSSHSFQLYPPLRVEVLH